ncbi:MAG: alpha/beta hydrolase [Gammaproteobacteria bacterium]|nr:alpha/beta hydrolase [Gammaproteobacteria bacterium]
MPTDAHLCRTPDGRALSYTEWGEPSGIPVFYCHGFPGSRLEARLADAPARTLGIRLVAPDRPGFGGSDFQPNRRITDWPGDVTALADHLGVDRFHVIGVSGGAPYALAAAAQLQDRVEAVALVCGLGEFIGDSPTAGMNSIAAMAIEFRRHWPQLGHWAYAHLIGPVLRRFPDSIFQVLVGHAPDADRDVLADPAVRDAIVASYEEAFRQGSDGPAHELGLITSPWEFNLAQVTQPVQLWHGDADQTVPIAMAERYAENLPDVSTHFIPGEGHFSLIVRHMQPILAGLTGRQPPA